MGLITDFRYRKISQTATVNDLLKETFRKSIHICSSIVPFLAAWNYSVTLITLFSVICVYSICEFSRITGHPIPFVSYITAFAARRRDEGRFVLGPVTMGVGVLFTLIIFPPEIAHIGIFALAFGDGIASLAGKLYGKIKIPYTNGKTLEGSTACFIAVCISTFVLTFDPVRSLLVGLLSAIIEVFPLKDYDNLLIPLLISGFVWLLP